MPYVQHYVPAPKNMDLKVYPDLPGGYVEERIWLIHGYREARKSGSFDTMYFCDLDCKGWIEGEPNDYPVNTLEPEHLAGRRGREYFCRRCGRQIAFIGLMS